MNTDPQKQAWSLLLAARSMVDRFWFDRQLAPQAVSFVLDANTATVEQQAGHTANAQLAYGLDQQWHYHRDLSREVCDLLDLYLPFLGSVSQPKVVTGHLGQSVDAKVATVSGDAFFVTGEENRRHLHCMRALSHAVIVGASTVAIDNPQLTTREVAGDSPVRVIIDPDARVSIDSGMLNDQQSLTLLLHKSSVIDAGVPARTGVKRVAVPVEQDQWTPETIVSVLATEGLHRLFVEGGGVTVSRFLMANGLHSLQIATAPVLVGEGRAAIQLPGALTMKGALRPPCRLYRMGYDTLWDFDLRSVVFDQQGMVEQIETPASIPDEQLTLNRSIERLF